MALILELNNGNMYSQLTKLIGKRFIYQGEVWLMVEVLRDEDAVVIVPEQAAMKKQIQANQYGHASRRCESCHTLPLTNGACDAYSDAVMELLSGKIPD